MVRRITASDKIKRTARVYIPGAEVLLFGSRARKDECTDSDYDILIITSKEFSSEQKTHLRTKIRKNLLKEGIRSDILVQNKIEIEKKRRLPGHIIRNILKEAVIL